MTGKRVLFCTYFHVDSLEISAHAVRSRVEIAERAAGVERRRDFNVVRFDEAYERIGLLNYPGFYEKGFPELLDSWLVDLAENKVRHRTYVDSSNRPILHRKELLLPPDHARRPEFVALTEAAEAIGLFDDPSRIGFRSQWEQLVRDKGFRVVGHQLIPIGNDEGTATDEVPRTDEQSLILRHLTALVRYGFSAPVQSLARYGFLDGRFSVFDYGCGRGDDIRGLEQNGIRVGGWDPYFAPTRPKTSSEIVNLGFVINVIEDFDERVCALRSAYGLAERLLVVSVMLANQNALEGKLFNDGILTRRGTFQKYFTQSELKSFLQQVLDEAPIAVAPGIFFVFRDKDLEQGFLVNRFGSRRRVLRQGHPATSRPEPRSSAQRKQEKFEAFREPLTQLWGLCNELGRMPDNTEVGEIAEPLLEGFGTLNKALRFVSDINGSSDLDEARSARVSDLTTYFALALFERRKQYRHLEPRLQRDVKAFFGDYASALQSARELLFQIARSDLVYAACRKAAEHGIGWLTADESLQLHSRLVDRLPSLLRVYVGCATTLYGDYRTADLIKIHIRSGKLTLMRFDDFDGTPLPRMIERVKIKLREQECDYFLYGDEFDPPFLYNKSRYINEEFESYPEQVEFDEALSSLGLFDLSGYGQKPADFLAVLAENRYEIDGFKLVRSRSIPQLDQHCGQHFRYQDFIECGETQARTGLPNIPKNPDSYTALLDLAINLLDPLVDYFGMIKLTYGFCCAELAKEIPGRIAPRLDQHAAHEKNRSGELICSRQGAAVDFLVEDENMFEVANWIAANLPFDRMYVYGADRPIHLSFGPAHLRQVIQLRHGPSAQLVPKVVRLATGADGALQILRFE